MFVAWDVSKEYLSSKWPMLSIQMYTLTSPWDMSAALVKNNWFIFYSDAESVTRNITVNCKVIPGSSWKPGSLAKYNTGVCKWVTVKKSKGQLLLQVNIISSSKFAIYICGWDFVYFCTAACILYFLLKNSKKYLIKKKWDILVCCQCVNVT